MDILAAIGRLATMKNLSTAAVFIVLMIIANFFEGRVRTLLVVIAFAATAAYFMYFS